MLKKTISYVDYDGDSHTEDFYFHLSKRELVLLQSNSAHKDGISGEWTEVVKSGHGGRIMEIFDRLIVSSFGRRSEDNKSFMKSPAISEEFKHSAPYDVLFMELVTNADAGSTFFNGVVPADMAKAAMEEAKILNMTGSEKFAGHLKDVQTTHTDLVESKKVKLDPNGIEWDIDLNQPMWVTENRVPTKKEIIAATPEQMVIAMGRRVGAEKIREE